jgi:hypothetical protein
LYGVPVRQLLGLLAVFLMFAGGAARAARPLDPHRRFDPKRVGGDVAYEGDILVRGIEGGRARLWDISLPNPALVTVPPGGCLLDIAVTWDWSPPVRGGNVSCPAELAHALDRVMGSWSVDRISQPMTGAPHILVRAHFALVAVGTAELEWAVTISPANIVEMSAGLPMVAGPLVSARRISRVRYRESTRHIGDSGCKAEVLVSTEGRAEVLAITGCAPAFQLTTRRRVERWRFEPWLVDGVAQVWVFRVGVTYAAGGVLEAWAAPVVSATALPQPD